MNLQNAWGWTAVAPETIFFVIDPFSPLYGQICDVPIAISIKVERGEGFWRRSVDVLSLYRSCLPLGSFLPLKSQTHLLLRSANHRDTEVVVRVIVVIIVVVIPGFRGKVRGKVGVVCCASGTTIDEERNGKRRMRDKMRLAWVGANG